MSNFDRFFNKNDGPNEDDTSLGNSSINGSIIGAMDMFGVDSDIKTKEKPAKGKRFCRFTFFMMVFLIVIVACNPEKLHDRVVNEWSGVSTVTNWTPFGNMVNGTTVQDSTVPMTNVTNTNSTS